MFAFDLRLRDPNTSSDAALFSQLAEAVAAFGPNVAPPWSQNEPGCAGDRIRVPRASVLEIVRWLREATRNGLYPVVAYSIGDNRCSILTTNIPDLDYSLKLLEKHGTFGYNLGRNFSEHELDRLSSENPHVLRRHSHESRGLTSSSAKGFGRVVQAFGAPYFRQKAVGLVDIVGFSTLSHWEQLAHLYSLRNALNSSMKRCMRFCSALGIPPLFGAESTGDGYYVWHEEFSGACDAATFMLVTSILTQCECFRRESGFPLRLRASYCVGPVYQMYDNDTLEASLNAITEEEIDLNSDHLRLLASMVTGPATIQADRVLRAARPSQFLVADFDRPGIGEARMTPSTLIQQANGLFELENNGPAVLDFAPGERLKLFDKHGFPHYCWNVCGQVPNIGKGPVARQRIGLRTDSAPDIKDLGFQADV